MRAFCAGLVTGVLLTILIAIAAAVFAIRRVCGF